MNAARGVLLAVLLMLPGCVSTIDTGRTTPLTPGTQPAEPVLGAALPAGHTRYDNGSLADLFVMLTHDLEWGPRRPHLMRYEGPVRVGLGGPGSGRYVGFLDRYLAELRNRAGVVISRADNPNLLINFVPGPEFRARLPRQSCLVAPGNISWQVLREDTERYGSRAFEVQRKLTAMSVFIPETAQPHLVRACLIEEIAQALGPVNDLYGLGPSIFNDDGAHVWPTALDYLMLRVLYQPEMRTGLSRTATRAAARAVLTRLNPAGRSAPPLPRPRQREMRDWAEDVRAIFTRGTSGATRERLAQKVVNTSIRRGRGDAYDCRARMALARVLRGKPDRAAPAIDRAIDVCTAAHGGGDIRIIRLKLDKAHALYRLGRISAAYGLSQQVAPLIAAHGLEERLVALYALQAAALGAIQQPRESRVARQRAAEWGAFALGRDHPRLRPLLAR